MAKPLLSGNHQIASQLFDVYMDQSLKPQDVQDAFSRAQSNRLEKTISAVLDEFDQPGKVLRFGRLQLDIGTIQYAHLEHDLVEGVEVHLRRALRQAIDNPEDEQLSEVEEDEVVRAARLFEYFLLHGIFPWYARDKEVTPEQLFDLLRTKEMDRLLRMVRDIGRKTEVRRRLILQLDDAQLEALVHGLEPVHAQFIIEYGTEIQRKHEQEPLVRDDAQSFREARWELILRYLLVDRGSLFNRMAFLEGTLRGLASHYRIDYLEFLRFMTSEIEVESVPENVKTSLPFLIQQLLEKEEQKLTSREEGYTDIGQSTIDSLLEKGSTTASETEAIVRYFLEHLSLPSGLKGVRGKAAFETLFLKWLASASSAQLLQLQTFFLVRDLTRSPAGILSEAVNVEVLKRLFPGQAATVREDAQQIVGLLERSPAFHSMRQQIREMQWPVLFSAILGAGSGATREAVLMALISAWTEFPGIQRQVSSSGISSASAGLVGGGVAVSTEAEIATKSSEGIGSHESAFVAVLIRDGGSMLSTLSSTAQSALKAHIARSTNVTSTELGRQLTILLEVLASPERTGLSKLSGNVQGAINSLKGKASDPSYVQAISDILQVWLHEQAITLGLSKNQLLAFLNLEMLEGKAVASPLVKLVKGQADAMLQQTAAEFKTAKKQEELTHEKENGLQQKRERQQQEKAAAGKSNARADATPDGWKEPETVSDWTSEFERIKRKEGGAKVQQRFFQRQMDLMLHYFRYGSLPWWSPVKKESRLRTLFIALIKEDGKRVRGILLAWLQRSSSIQSFAQHVSKENLITVLDVIRDVKFTPKGSSVTQRFVGWVFALAEAIERSYATSQSNRKSLAARWKFYALMYVIEMREVPAGKALQKLIEQWPKQAGISTDVFREIVTWYFLEIADQRSTEELLPVIATWIRTAEGKASKEWKAEELLKVLRAQRGFELRDMPPALALELQKITATEGMRNIEQVFAMARHPEWVAAMLQHQVQAPRAQRWLSESELYLFMMEAGRHAPQELGNLLQGPMLRQLLVSTYEATELFQLVEVTMVGHVGFSGDDFRLIHRDMVHFASSMLSSLEFDRFETSLFHALLHSPWAGPKQASRDEVILFYLRLIERHTRISLPDVLDQLDAMSTISTTTKQLVSENPLLSGLRQREERLEQESEEDERALIEPDEPEDVEYEEAGKSTDEDLEEDEEEEEDFAGESIFIRNAGLVLLWPYFATLFERSELMKAGLFNDTKSAYRAVHLLHYLVWKEERPAESELLLNKIFCKVKSVKPVVRNLTLTKEEMDLCDSLIAAAIENWGALGSTSVQGFREAFLQRNGRLKLEDGRYELVVEEKPYDMLLDRLTWSIGHIKTSWMELSIVVKWR